ncbi:NADH-quinone oxidoreductase subunit A [soil metagenome]
MIPNYAFIGILMLGAIGFALAPLVLVFLIAPRKHSRAKGDTYECGVLTTGETWIRFRLQYYIFALLFVVFDIETVFLYPWAVAYGGLGAMGLGPFALGAMILFLVMLADALVYAWSKGDLRWV